MTNVGRFGFTIMLMLFWVLLAAANGCGGGRKPAPDNLVPFSGTVTLDGQPLAKATVFFIPSQPGMPGTAASTGQSGGAVTDDAGNFELRTGEGNYPGAVPGEYRVVISRFEMPDGTVTPLTRDKSPMQMAIEGAKETVPANFSDMAFSKLRHTIPPGGGTVEFELSSSGN